MCQIIHFGTLAWQPRVQMFHQHFLVSAECYMYYTVTNKFFSVQSNRLCFEYEFRIFGPLIMFVLVLKKRKCKGVWRITSIMFYCLLARLLWLLFQSTSMAYHTVNEDTVYTCVGHPLRRDIENIVNWLLNEAFITAYNSILHFLIIWEREALHVLGRAIWVAVT